MYVCVVCFPSLLEYEDDPELPDPGPGHYRVDAADFNKTNISISSVFKPPTNQNDHEKYSPGPGTYSLDCSMQLTHENVPAVSIANKLRPVRAFFLDHFSVLLLTSLTRFYSRQARGKYELENFSPGANPTPIYHI